MSVSLPLSGRTTMLATRYALPSQDMTLKDPNSAAIMAETVEVMVSSIGEV